MVELEVNLSDTVTGQAIYASTFASAAMVPVAIVSITFITHVE